MRRLIATPIAIGMISAPPLSRATRLAAKHQVADVRRDFASSKLPYHPGKKHQARDFRAEYVLEVGDE